MEKNFCPNCATENESDYIYCKNCGAQLKPEKSKSQTQNYQSQTYHQQTVHNTVQENRYNTDSGYENINYDGASAEEMGVYIGKKANEILPKFTKMQITGSKVSWCWPVAVLSFLLGPLGAAMWFFYRKMYKHAAIFTVLGTALAIILSVFSPTLSEETMTAMESAVESYDVEAIFELFSSINPTTLIFTWVVGMVENTAHILTCVICGIYSYHWYKIQCAEKIREYRALQSDPRYYRIGLAAIGGVSGGMLALGIVLYCIINTMSSIISAVLAYIL